MRLQRTITVSAVAATVLALVVAAGTLGDGAPLFPDWIVAPLVVLPLAICGAALLSDPDRGRSWAAFKRLPPWRRRGMTAVMLLIWLIGAFSLYQLRHGGPERHGNHVYARNHTQLTPVSMREYEHLRRVQERLFAIGSIFFFVGVLGSGRVRNRRSKVRPTAGLDNTSVYFGH
jgi:hypothetical protein